MSEPAVNSGDDTRARLAKLLAAVLWSSADHFADIYENHLLDSDGECPTVDIVELTEHSPPRVDMILSGGEEYTVRVEPKEDASHDDGDRDSAFSRRSAEEDFAAQVIEASRDCGEMTLDELRNVTSVVSNASFCRHWINWFDPSPGSDLPPLMALCALNGDGSPVGLYERDMKERGFVKRTDPGGLEFWFVRRVDDEGHPWENRPPA